MRFKRLLILGKRNRMEKFLDEGEYLIRALVPVLRLSENPVQASPLGGLAGFIRKATPRQRSTDVGPGPTLPKDPRHLLNGGSRKRRRWSDDHSSILQHMLPTRGGGGKHPKHSGRAVPRNRPPPSRAWPPAASGWRRPPPAGPAVCAIPAARCGRAAPAGWPCSTLSAARPAATRPTRPPVPVRVAGDAPAARPDEVHADDDAVEATEFRHRPARRARRASLPRAACR